MALQRAHNNPVRFWTTFLGAVAVAAPEALRARSGRDIAALATGEGAVDAVLEVLHSVTTTITIVVDDYHCIADTGIIDGLSHILADLPPTVSCAIGSRPVPDLRLSRLRSQHQVVEVGREELFFSRAEVEEVLAGELGPVEADLASKAHAATDGWPALVSLAAQVASGPAELAALIERGIATERWIADFVIDELIDAQTPHIRDFLLDVGALSELNPDLCDAVRLATDSSVAIDALDRLGLIVSLDTDRQWWRFHHLVSDVLVRRTRIERHADIRERHARAAAWLSEHGHHRDAVEHGIAGKRFDIAAQNVVPALELFQVEPGDETRWFDRFPDDVLANDRELLGEVALYVRIVGTPEQRTRLQSLADTLERTTETALPEIDWQVVLGNSLVEANNVIDTLLTTRQSGLWQRFLPGIAAMAAIANENPERARAIARAAMSSAPDKIFLRTMAGFASVAEHHLD
ncbi:MAG: hypothetical protein AAFY28_16950, partial [Actinomycetota bacterium]